jgi:hypothetical protein
MSNLNTLTTTEICRRWQDVENTLQANVAQANSIKADLLDELSARSPAASCAFLRAVVMGESVKPKDFFAEPEKPKDEKPKEQPTSLKPVK